MEDKKEKHLAVVYQDTISLFGYKYRLSALCRLIATNYKLSNCEICGFRLLTGETSRKTSRLKVEISICRTYMYMWGTRWRRWMRHCATNRHIAGSIPADVIAIFLLT